MNYLNGCFAVRRCQLFFLNSLLKENACEVGVSRVRKMLAVVQCRMEKESTNTRENEI